MQEDRIVDPWGERTPFAAGQAWPVRVDMLLEEGLEEGDIDRWPRRPRCSIRKVTPWTSPSRTTGLSVCAVAPATASTTGAWTRGSVRMAGQQLAGPAREPAGARQRPPRVRLGNRDGRARAPAVSGCFATCTTCTCWPASATWRGRSSARPRRLFASSVYSRWSRSARGETAIQLKWLRTRMKQAAPQALVVASDERRAAW